MATLRVPTWTYRIASSGTIAARATVFSDRGEGVKVAEKEVRACKGLINLNAVSGRFRRSEECACDAFVNGPSLRPKRETTDADEEGEGGWESEQPPGAFEMRLRLNDLRNARQANERKRSHRARPDRERPRASTWTPNDPLAASATLCGRWFDSTAEDYRASTLVLASVYLFAIQRDDPSPN